MRISAADVRRPEDHQKVYFLPERSRFVVVGMQTLQIWSLPTKENRDLSLLFIWSRPKVNDDLPRLKENPIDHTRNGGNLANQDHTGDNLTETSDNTASSQEPASNSKKPGRRTIETEPVGEFYHYIRDAEVFFDCETGEVEARVTLEGGFGVDTVRIPGERSSNNRSVFLNCAQSIHLLAASYAYSAQEDKLPKIQGKSSFTFKEHSEAIARFTRSHINRLLHSKYFKPLPLSEPVVYVPRQPVQEQTTSPRGKPGTSNQESDASYQLLFLLRSEASAEKPRSSQNTPSSVELLKNMVYDFVQTNVARLWNRNDEDAGRDETFTVLTLLLGEESLKEANRLFIEGLFKDGHEWVPHPSLAVNPIERVIDMEDERLLTIMIDYCIKNAHDHHPGYLTPVTQCLIKLREVDAELVRDVFKRASHIPVRNPQYVTSHAIITNLRFLDLFSFLDQYASSRKFFEFSKSSKIEKYKAPVLGLRSKLPFHNHTGVVGSISDHIRRRRKTQFPPEKVADQTGENRRKIYVSPFQFKPFKGQSRSFLGEFAGENFFDSPVMEANLWYKWNKSGIYFWLLRFIVVLIYFILVLTITGQQIRVSTPSIEHKPTQEELEDRYLPGWHPAFYMTITIGCLLLIYEFLQMKFSTWKYFRSPFNYIELVAYISPVAGCFIFMQERLLEYFRDKITEGGPSQIIILAFAIIAIYVNMVSELRIIRPLGIAVNIIINITKKIGWFLFIFALFLISFTHALLYVLHTRRYRECEVKDEDGSCKDSDYPSNYPTNFFEALGTTYFFMSGRYDPVDTSFDKGTVGFRLMMMVFFFFTVIVLLNVLIALMNDAFNKSEREGEIAYWRLLSEVIAELEMVSWYYQGKSIDDDDNYSEYIYYVKSDEEVKQFQARCATSDVSTLAQSVKDEHKETRRTIVDDNKGELLAVKQELEDLKDLIRLLVQQQSPQPQGGTASQNNTQSPDNTQSQVDTLSQRNTSSQGNTQS
ncbi:MAG: hypothetical protein J3Q66DRAFT_325657 [Benniella sp.]|nr:MAG: hypothetical protein J3Q66DRAFT_325657 [Benniella sp.]